MDETNKDKEVPFYTSCRAFLAGMGFLGCICIYLLRINFSVAIVCMTIDSENTTGSGNNTDAYYHNPAPFESYFRNFLGLEPYEEDTCPSDGDDDADETGEFDWDRQLRGTLGSAFFWGYVLTQVLGGWLAVKIGGKKVVTLGFSLAVGGSFLSPAAARLSPYALMVARFINGIGQGGFFPAFYHMLGNWAPPGERSRLGVFFMSGVSIGNVFSFGLSGIICADLGWQWVFYIYAIITLIWLIGWIVLVYETPNDHPRITKEEVDYIERTLGRKVVTKRPPVPWFSLLTCPTVLAIAVCDFCNGWAGYAGLTQLPQYMEDVLEVNIRQNGLYNSLPHVMKWFASIGFAVLADFLINNTKLQIITIRKIMNTFGALIPMAFVIGVGYLDCNTVSLAVTFLTLQEGFVGAVRSGSQIARVDVAPRFAGVVMGICNTLGQMPGIIAPIVISSITSDGTREQWQKSFFMSAGFYLLGWLSFVLVARGGVMEWAKAPDEKEELKKVEDGLEVVEYDYDKKGEVNFAFDNTDSYSEKENHMTALPVDDLVTEL